MSENKFIPLSVPNFKGNEVEYVTDAVRTGWVSTAGTYVNKFEQQLAQYLHMSSAVACQSGTAALHIGLMLCGVTREDAVIAPTLTFIAAVNPILYVGAAPILMDCDDSLCMDPVKVEAFCHEECRMEGNRLIEKSTGRHVKAMVIVHVFGNMADMDALLRIAQKYNLKVVEDATEALGTFYTSGLYCGKYAGTMGDIAALSFNGNKIITTGGGGAILSMDKAMLDHAKHLTTQAKVDEVNYIHDEVGYNYRMTNVQAALGVAQMEELEGFIGIKQRNFVLYQEGVKDIPGLRLLDVRMDIRSNRWFYALYCKGYRMDRDALIKHLAERKIQSRPIWGLICDQKPYTECRSYRIEKARDYHAHVVNVPCGTDLTSEDVAQVLDCLKG